MKKIIMLTLLLMVITGCNVKDVKEPIKKDTKFEEKGTIDNISYEVLDNCNFSNNYDKEKRKKIGYFIDTLNQPNAPYYYIIQAGEKPTGGYDINIVDLKKENDKFVVTVKETSPNPGQIVTEAFTYPKCCIRFNKSVDVQIKNTNGDIFEYVGS